MTRDIIAEKLGIDWSHDMTWNVNAVRLCKLIWELEEKASRDSRILSAVPSEELTKLYTQFDAMRNMFDNSNVGSYNFNHAMVCLGDAISHFKYFEKQRGIAG